jgi:tetratricopeptide (TPR) repeat protein
MTFTDGTLRSGSGGIPAMPADPVLGTVFLGDTEVRLYERSGAVARRFNRPGAPERRREPLRELLAAPFFAGRAVELSNLVKLISSGRRVIVEVVGKDGLGKSTLLQELLAEPIAATFDAVAMVRGSCGFDDALQTILESAYLFDQPYVPLARERERLSTGLRMLVAVEDFEGALGDARRLANTLPASSIIFTSDRLRLAKLATTVQLESFDPRDAAKLYSYVTGRPAGDDCIAGQSGGNLSPTPLELKLAAAADGLPPSEIGLSGAHRHVWEIAGDRASLDMRVLATFVAFGGGPLDVAFAIDMIGFPPESIFAGLERRGLLDCDGERYFLRRWVLDVLREHPSLPRVDNALITFGDWLETFPASRRIAACGEAANQLLRNSWYATSLPDVIRVGRLLGDALLFAGRPNLALEAYQIVSDAAALNGDRVSEAWAAHQTGTVSFALGDDGAATSAFHHSLELREKANNALHIAVTRRNLSMALGIRSPGAPPAKAAPAAAAKRARLGWAVAAVTVFIVGTVALVLNPFARRSVLHRPPVPALHHRGHAAAASRELPVAALVPGLRFSL